MVLIHVSGCDSFEPFDNSPKERMRVSNDSRETSKSPTPKEDIAERIDPSYSKKAEMRFLRAPILRSLDIPLSHGMNSIWGATGRDHLGRIYFGVSAWDGLENPSGVLFRFDPTKNSFEALGHVNEQLDKLGIRRMSPFPETQIKIHSKIIQAEDGKLYFSTQDENQEKEDGSSGALFGGRLFAIDPNSQQWECIHTAPEGLIALAARGQYVVAQGYFGHVL